MHEVLNELVKDRPAVIADLLTELFKLDLPSWRRVRVDSGEFTEVTPTEYRADTVAAFTDAAGTPVLAVISEIQLRRDPDKRRTWPHYLTSLHARWGCPAVLLVISVDAATARWCAAPIEIGHPGLVLRPLVLGPEQVPVVTDPGQADRVPELAVLSALTHGTGPEQERVLRAMLSALRHVDDQHAAMYTDLILGRLPEAARQVLEGLVNVATYEYQSDYARRYLYARRKATARATAAGEARALLAVLAARDIDVPEAVRERITGCTDLDQLEAWVRRAATATSVHDLFD